MAAAIPCRASENMIIVAQPLRSVSLWAGRRMPGPRQKWKAWRARACCGEVSQLPSRFGSRPLAIFCVDAKLCAAASGRSPGEHPTQLSSAPAALRDECPSPRRFRVREGDWARQARCSDLLGGCGKKTVRLFVRGAGADGGVGPAAARSRRGGGRPVQWRDGRRLDVHWRCVQIRCDVW